MRLIGCLLDSRHIDVLIHPQQAIHGMVYFRDGSIIAQLGGTDMRTPISYAMAWQTGLIGEPSSDLAAISALTFEAVDLKGFRVSPSLVWPLRQAELLRQC